MRLNTRDFRGRVELGSAPPRMTGDDIVAFAEHRQRWLDNGGVPGGSGDPVRRTGVKRKSILFRLPYWQVSF